MAKDLLITTETLKTILPVVNNKKTTELGAVQSDWNQNDPNALDYIKNRICYEEAGAIQKIDPKYLPEIPSSASDILLSNEFVNYFERGNNVETVLGSVAEDVNYLSNSVLYTTQTLTDEQKIQARTNIGAAALALTSTQVTLISSNWSASYPYTQTVTVNGVSADEMAQLIIPSPASSNSLMYYNYGILCTGQGENQLTFTSEIRPSSDLLMYVMIQGA